MPQNHFKYKEKIRKQINSDIKVIFQYLIYCVLRIIAQITQLHVLLRLLKGFTSNFIDIRMN